MFKLFMMVPVGIQLLHNFQCALFVCVQLPEALDYLLFRKWEAMGKNNCAALLQSRFQHLTIQIIVI